MKEADHSYIEEAGLTQENMLDDDEEDLTIEDLLNKTPKPGS